MILVSWVNVSMLSLMLHPVSTLKIEYSVSDFDLAIIIWVL